MTSRMSHKLRPSRQMGAATLVVIMVLFFMVSMVAAYASRGIIFEQKTGANLYRATQAIEAAEAGLEWALMQLNDSLITDDCVADASGANTFRQRYLNINTTTGLVAPRVGPTSGVTLTPTCFFDDATGRWVCECPTDAAPEISAPAGVVAPAFRIRFFSFSSLPGYIRIESVGCTRLDDACLVRTGSGLDNEGRAVVRSVVYIGSQSIARPKAALTVRGSMTATALNVANVRVVDGGVTIHASGNIDTSPPSLTLTTLAGNALSGSTIPNDAALDLPALGSEYSARDRFFAAIFNLMPATWLQQPALVRVDCSSGCDAQDLRDQIEANPMAPLWIEGDVDINGSTDIGTATSPALLVINGDLSFSTSGVTIYGLVLVRPTDVVSGWAINGSGRIVGAVVVDGPVSGSGALEIQYDGDVLSAVKATAGSFARVPGSWRDW
jgi:hypothetical protein